jgi:hypothetical protein
MADRTLVSISAPNLITIPLMAFGGFLVAALIWQGVMRFAPGAASAGGGSTAGNGAEPAAFSEGY